MEQIMNYELRITNKENPMILKKELATQIVAELHSPSKAEEAKNEFETRFQKKELHESDLPTKSLSDFPKSVSVLEALVIAGIAESNSAARRLIEQKAVKINTTHIESPKEIVSFKKNDILQAGKKAVKIVKENSV
jgi:tyrosyl-tRNA synthetase